MEISSEDGHPYLCASPLVVPIAVRPPELGALIVISGSAQRVQPKVLYLNSQELPTIRSILQSKLDLRVIHQFFRFLTRRSLRIDSKYGLSSRWTHQQPGILHQMLEPVKCIH